MTLPALPEIRILPALLLCTINFLFAYKYSARVTGYALLFSIAYTALALLAILSFDTLPERAFHRRLRLGYLFAFSLALLALFHFLPVERVRVDRWDIIQRFWDALFRGEFPYAIRSMHNNPPGPLPVYFLLSIPFYLLKEVGYATLLALYLFAGLLSQQFASEKTRTVILVLLTTSAAFLWEASVRSTLFANVVVFLGYAHFAERLRLGSNPRQAILFGFLGGLVLSTRGAVGLPLAVTSASLFGRSRRWAQGMLWAVMVLAGLAVTLLPFAVWDWNAFRSHNPIMVEESFVPWPALVFLVLLALFAGLRSPSLKEQCWYAGAILFGAVTLSFLRFVSRFGWEQSFWGSRFDISYYVLSLPFLLLALVKTDGTSSRASGAGR